MKKTVEKGKPEVTNAVDVFQFGTVWGHSEQNERSPRAGPGGKGEVS